jgi:hypothetical protein
VRPRVAKVRKKKMMATMPNMKTAALVKENWTLLMFSRST